MPLASLVLLMSWAPNSIVLEPYSCCMCTKCCTSSNMILTVIHTGHFRGNAHKYSWVAVASCFRAGGVSATPRISTGPEGSCINTAAGTERALACVRGQPCRVQKRMRGPAYSGNNSRRDIEQLLQTFNEGFPPFPASIPALAMDDERWNTDAEWFYADFDLDDATGWLTSRMRDLNVGLDAEDPSADSRWPWDAESA